MRLILLALAAFFLTACSQSTADKFKALKGKHLVNDSTLKLNILGQPMRSVKDEEHIGIIFNDSTIDTIDPYLGKDSGVSRYRFEPENTIYTWFPTQTIKEARSSKIEFSGSSIIITETISEETIKNYFHIN